MKMMDFKKGDWCNIMDGLYWRFIDRNRKFFLKNPRLSMMVRILDKMKQDRKKLIFSAADKINFFLSVFILSKILTIIESLGFFKKNFLFRSINLQ